MTRIVYTDFEQGSLQWYQARLGIVTSSEVENLLTPAKLEPSKSAIGLINRLASERIRGIPEPGFVSADMERGKLDEVSAREIYCEHFAPVEQVGFIKATIDGVEIGFSPDGLVGDDGFIECKSRAPKFQVQTIISGEMPRDYWLQIQTGLLVSGRKWCDFISYSDGMHLFVDRIMPCETTQGKILEAVVRFYDELETAIDAYWAEVKRRKLIYIRPVTVLED